jgi:hypothetical protein
MRRICLAISRMALRGEVVGAKDLCDPPDAGTYDHRRPFVRRD